MKHFSIIAFVLILMLGACTPNTIIPAYVYESNPNYSYGYAEFFGSYYAAYGNKNHVLSLTFLSDSLKINNIGQLEGIGQYLFLEDVFVDSTVTILPTGTYTIDNSGAPFTVAPGKNDTVDNAVFPIGATIYYYEPNPTKSTQKLITQGSFTLNRSGLNYQIIFNFITDDKKELKGSYDATLSYIDESIITNASGIRRKIKQ